MQKGIKYEIFLRNNVKFKPTKKCFEKAYEKLVKNTFIDFGPKRSSNIGWRNSFPIKIWLKI